MIATLLENIETYDGCLEYSRQSIGVNGSYSMTENSLKLTNHFKKWRNLR